MPILIEQFVVGHEAVANQAGRFRRFTPKARLDEVLTSWAIGTDRAVHVRKMDGLFDRGATVANVHSGQAEHAGVVESYDAHVIPGIRHHA